MTWFDKNHQKYIKSGEIYWTLNLHVKYLVAMKLFMLFGLVLLAALVNGAPPMYDTKDIKFTDENGRFFGYKPTQGKRNFNNKLLILDDEPEFVNKVKRDIEIDGQYEQEQEQDKLTDLLEILEDIDAKVEGPAQPAVPEVKYEGMEIDGYDNYNSHQIGPDNSVLDRVTGLAERIRNRVSNLYGNLGNIMGRK